MEISVSMARRTGCDEIYAAATMWKERCLLADGSVFGAGALWTVEHVTELVHHFVENPDTGQRSVEEKLKDQLAKVSPEARQLAAEMLWVTMLFPSPSDISCDRKIELVCTVWDWTGTPLHDTTGALAALADGIGSGGSDYSIYLPFELHLLVRFAAAWKALDRSQHLRLSDDAWAFADWFDRLQGAQSRQLRHMLLHLLYPDEFERIASRDDKRRIDVAFSKELRTAGLGPTRPGLPAIERDRRLRQIRRLLEQMYPGVTLDFYDSPELQRVWREPTEGNGGGGNPPGPGARAWVIGAGEGATRWPSFSDGGYVAIGWDELGDLDQFKTRDALQTRLKQVYEREQDPLNDSLACYQFCREMSEGDEIYVKHGRDRVLGYGRIIGPYEHDESRPDYQNVRRVEWISKGNWLLPNTALCQSRSG